MSEENKPAEEKQIPPPDLIPWTEFLEDYPISSVQNVSGYYEETGDKYGHPYRRTAPILRLHCAKCKGVRNFSGRWVREGEFSEEDVVRDFLKYTCKDCEKKKGVKSTLDCC